MKRQQTDQLAEQVLVALNAHDLGQIDRLTSPDVELRLPPGRVFSGRQGLRDFFSELQARLPELTVVARKTYTGEDHAIVEWESVGRSLRRSQVETMGVFVIQVSEGLIARIQVYLDTAQWAALSEELQGR